MSTARREPLIAGASASGRRSRVFVSTLGAVLVFGSLGVLPICMGEDRVLFSIDYPYEDSREAGHWLNAAPLSETTRAKVAHGNAASLLRLSSAHVLQPSS